MNEKLLQAKNLAEEASAAKSMFLANMSHEVRTPMSTIMGMIDLTLDTPLNEEQKDNLTTVKNAADILLSLLNDILDLSRVEAGKIQIENIALDIESIVQNVCKGLSVLASKKRLELEWKIDPQVPRQLIGDPVRVRQVLVNLINNAIKFAFRGKVRITVDFVGADEETTEVQFSVVDQGIGIAQDTLDKIFDAFTQADSSTTRRFGGTGLGLSISKRLVEMMGGRIWAESEEYKGSTFCFTAKFRNVRKEEFVGQQAQDGQPVEAGQAGNNLGVLNILLAEDNIVNQKITVKMLEKRGWVVKTAENGKQVLEMLDAQSFDIILMDAQMPVLDGFEATQKIRENEKETGQHIPIVALTARAMSADKRKCLDSGMDGYVSKPIDRQKLYEAIENMF